MTGASMEHKVGTVLRIKEDIPVFTHRRGLLVRIEQPLAIYHGVNQAGKKASLLGYGVVLLGCTTKMTVAHSFLEPMPEPVRGDLDTKTTWAECSWQPKEKGQNNDY